MLTFIVLVCVCVCGSVPLPEADPQPAAYASDYSYYLPANNPSSQYHAQDELGAYTYGYNSAEQTKSEVKTADGVVRGSYSYIDANGIVQTVNYISDAMGFRVAATNLPVHEVEAAVVPAAAPVVQEAPVSAAVAVAAPEQVLTPNVPYAYLPYATNYGYHVAPTQYVHAAPVVQAATPVVHAASPVVYHAAAPVVEAAIPSGEAAIPVVYQEAAPVVQAAPFAAPVPVVAAPTDQVFTKYHAQDELGQYSFGYNDATSNRQEQKTADGVVTGSYNYVDSNGRIQTVQYIADAAGFRVAGTNLPVHAAALPIDTPEVAAAKIQHAAAYSAIATEHAVEDVSVADPLVETALPVAPVVYQAAAPVAQAAAPVAQAAAPVAQATAPVAQAAAPVVQAAAPVVYQVAPAPVVQAAAPVVYQAAAPIVQAATPVAVIAPPAADSQFHSQDDIGQYSYGYSDGNSVKQEVKTADGVVRGAYSYVDADGIVQNVNYIADALGFRVGATNLPVHIVDETAHVAAAAPVAVAAAVPVAAVDYAPVMAPKIDYSYLPYATNYGYHGAVVAPQVVASPVVEAASYVTAAEESGAVPVVAADLPVAAAPAADPNTQFHAQDEFGQYNYGYSNPTQTKSEVKTADGVTRGSYSYIDANGLVQTVNYISDAMGFRVAATNLPVHHVEGVEVAEPVVEAKYNVLTPNVNYSYLPYAQGYAYNMPAQAA